MRREGTTGTHHAPIFAEDAEAENESKQSSAVNMGQASLITETLNFPLSSSQRSDMMRSIPRLWMRSVENENRMQSTVRCVLCVQQSDDG